jgi:hypothetical protein
MAIGTLPLVIADLRLVIAQRPFAVVRDAAKIRTNSFASACNFSNLPLLTMPASMSNSNQNAVSSASSTVMPIFEIKSARDLALQALR